jgi:hypothetical protein
MGMTRYKQQLTTFETLEKYYKACKLLFKESIFLGHLFKSGCPKDSWMAA